jgi:hypothetical protein
MIFLWGAYEAPFLQMKPYLITNLKLMWNSMLVTSLLVLGIGLLLDSMNLLLEVIYSFNKFRFSIFLGLSVGGICR